MEWIAGSVTPSADGSSFDVLYANDGATEFDVPSQRVKEVQGCYVIQRPVAAMEAASTLPPSGGGVSLRPKQMGGEHTRQRHPAAGAGVLV
jgi:hypothetical protein